MVLLVVGILQLINWHTEAQISIGSACGLDQGSCVIESIPLQQERKSKKTTTKQLWDSFVSILSQNGRSQGKMSRPELS